MGKVILEKDFYLVQEKLVKIMREILTDLPANISSERNIDTYVEFTSLEAIEIIAYIENEFQIEIEDELLGVGFLTSIREMTHVVYKYIKEKEQ